MSGFRYLGDNWWNRFRSLGQGGNKGRCPKWVQTADFELGALTPNPTGFDSVTQNPGTSITINSATPVAGAHSMQMALDGVDNAARYGVLNGPNSEESFTLEFLVNDSGMSMNLNDNFDVIALLSSVAAAVLYVRYYFTTKFWWRLRLYNDAGGSTLSTFDQGVVGTPPYKVRIEFKKSSAPGADDGYAKLYVNNVLQTQIVNFDNDTKSIGSIRLGATEGLGATETGAMIFDDIRWAGEIC